MAQRYRKLKFSALAILLAIIVAEALLRLVFAWQGYEVGSLAPNWFPKVRQGIMPRLQPSFFTDSTGMFRANQDYWNNEGRTINNDGFWGEGLTIDSTKSRILLIGDSFVWGAGATQPDSSFAARLAADTSARFYNTGIPGADPAQYQLIAERYIPALMPDVTMVFVYLGNDLVEMARPPQPYGHLYYPTSLGWFPGFYQGRYFDSLGASYQFYTEKYTPQGFWQKWVCNTAIGTAWYSLPLRFNEKRQREVLMSSTITNQHLQNIAMLCQQYGSRLIIIAIPYIGTDFSDGDEVNPEAIVERYRNVFKGFDGAVYMPVFSKSMFHPLPDGHFNNAGHYFTFSACQGYLNQYLTR